MRETYCKKCNYIFQFYKRVHHMEYCYCKACGVDWQHDTIFRFIGDDFGHRGA